MKNLLTWQMILHSYAQQVPVMMLYVLESSGSSPGRQGFFMAVNAKGLMQGSVGGGIMEHKFVELAKEKLQAASDKLQGSQVKKQVHDKSAAKNQSGMICSGEQTILVYEIKEQDIPAISELVASLKENKNGLLTLSPSGISFEQVIPLEDFSYRYATDNDWSYKEKTGYTSWLTIIGGGHCALALSKLMSGMDFYIRLYEDREQLNTLVQNDFVQEKIIVNDYAEIASLVQPGHHHYVVIMTVGYRTDDAALRALQGKTFAYLGLLGSRSKTQKMLDEYTREGLDPAWVQRIHAPVGLAIKSQTPEEIAVSIAAEIIQVKNASK